MKKKIKIGIIGKNFGYKIIYKSFIKNSKLEVVGFSSKLNNFKKYKIPKKIKIYKNWKSLILDKNIQAVVVATPPIYHKKIIKFAIKNKKHIFCEKPFTISSKEADYLTNLIKNKKLSHMVNYEFPEIEAFKFFKKKIINRKKIESVNLDWFVNIKKKSINNWKNTHLKGGGLLFNYVCQAIYYLEYFFGKINFLNSKIFYTKKKEIKHLFCILNFKKNLNIIFNAKFDIMSKNFFSKHELKLISKKEIYLLKTELNSYFDTFKVQSISKNGVYNKTIFEDKNNRKDFRIMPTLENSKKFSDWIINNNTKSPNFYDAKRIHLILDKLLESSKNSKIYSI